MPLTVSILALQGSSTMLCLAALHGLVALVGSDVDVMQVKPGNLKGRNLNAYITIATVVWHWLNILGEEEFVFMVIVSLSFQCLALRKSTPV